MREEGHLNHVVRSRTVLVLHRLGLWVAVCLGVGACWSPRSGAETAWVGRWPDVPRLGNPRSVCVLPNYRNSGNTYALVSAGWSGVQILDVTRASDPIPVAELDTRGSAEAAVSYTSGLVAVADGAAGLAVLDGVNPAAPRLVGVLDLGGFVADVAAYSSGYAVVANRQGLVQLVSISASEPPVLAATLPARGEANSVVIDAARRRAYVGGAQGLQVVDLRSPPLMRELGFFGTRFPVNGCALTTLGGRAIACVVDGGDGLSVLDVSNVSAIEPATLLGRVALAGGGHGVSVWANGGGVWVANGSKGLQAVEISNPAAPRWVGGPIPTGSEAIRVATVGSEVYVTDARGGIRILSAPESGQPGGPVLRGTIPLSGRVLSISARDTLLCLADGPMGVRWLDATRPARLQDLGNVGATLGASTIAVGVGSNGVAAGVVGEGWSEVRWYDLPRSGGGGIPSVARGVHRSLDPMFRPQGMAWDGDRLLVAAGAAGLAVFEVRDADHPVLRRMVTMEGGALGVAVRDGLAYVASGAWGVHVVAVQDPAAARVVGQTGPPAAGWRAVAVALSGAHAYLAAENRGLQVVDIAEPTRPRILGLGLETSGVAVGVTVEGERAFIADSLGGVTVLGVEVPAAPRFVDRWDTEGEARSVVVANEHLFVADDSRVLAASMEGLTAGSNSPPEFVLVPEWIEVEEDAGGVTITNWVQNVRPGEASSERWQTVRLEVEAVDSGGWFEEPPRLDSRGGLHFRLRPDVSGKVMLRVRAWDDGGTAGGGVDRSERMATLWVWGINDAPEIDAQPELGWRLEPSGLVALLTGLRPGPGEEETSQRLNVRVTSTRPEVLPHPVVEYAGGEVARLVFPTLTGWAGTEVVPLRVVLEDDGGTERGGIRRTEVERTLRNQPLDEPPVVTVLEPADGALLPLATTSIPVRLRTSDESGPLSILMFWTNQHLAGWVVPTRSEVTWNWTGLSPGVNSLEVRGVDMGGQGANPVLLSVVVARPPTLEASVGVLEVLEDSTSGPVILTVRPGIPPSLTPPLPTVRSLDPALVADDGIQLEEVDQHWIYRVTPRTNAVGEVILESQVEGAGGVMATNQVRVRIVPVDDPPEVVLEEPAQGARLSDGSAVALVAFARDIDGPIREVAFLSGGMELGVARTPPYAWVWERPVPGRHELSAVVRGEGEASLSVTSAPVVIEVVKGTNAAPTVAGNGPVTVYQDGVGAPSLVVVDDDRTPPERLVLRAESSDPELLPESQLVWRGEGGLRTLTLTPARGRSGSARVEVVVTDEEGLTAVLTIPVQVLPVSELPGGEACFADQVPEGFGTFNLLKLGRYRQGFGVVGEHPEPEGGSASIELRAPPRYTILSSSVAGPGGLRIALERSADGLFRWTEVGEEAALTETLPAGAWNTTYRLALAEGDSFNGFFPFQLSTHAPPVPKVSNLAEAGRVSADLPFVLAWEPWTGAGTNDRVVLTLVDEAGRTEFTAASDCTGQRVLGRRGGGVELPAGALRPDTRYTGFLAFGATQLAVNDRSPLLMLRAYHTRTTRFEVRTLPAGRAAPAVFTSVRPVGGRWVAGLRGSPGVRYRVEVSPDLVVWELFEVQVPTSAGTVDLLLPGSSGAGTGRFFRAVAEGSVLP